MSSGGAEESDVAAAGPGAHGDRCRSGCVGCVLDRQLGPHLAGPVVTSRRTVTPAGRPMLIAPDAARDVDVAVHRAEAGLARTRCGRAPPAHQVDARAARCRSRRRGRRRSRRSWALPAAGPRSSPTRSTVPTSHRRLPYAQLQVAVDLVEVMAAVPLATSAPPPRPVDGDWRGERGDLDRGAGRHSHDRRRRRRVAAARLRQARTGRAARPAAERGRRSVGPSQLDGDPLDESRPAPSSSTMASVRSSTARTVSEPWASRTDRLMGPVSGKRLGASCGLLRREDRLVSR